MNKQDCLLQLGEAQREINGFRNAAHLTDLQIEGYCKRIIELTARDAKLHEILTTSFPEKIAADVYAEFKMQEYGHLPSKDEAIKQHWFDKANHFERLIKKALLLVE